jgi:arylsulfatase A-like enzyme
LIVRWPGGVAAGRVCRQPTVNVDFYPTFLDAAGIDPEARQHLDGVSILPMLKDPDARPKRDTIYWHYPLQKPHFLGGRSAGAVRQGDWKLIEFYDTGEIELYNLADDIGETTNLRDELPGKVTELRRLLAEWRESLARPAD